LLAGGLITSAVFGAVAVFSKGLETRFASTLIAVHQLLYAFAEAFIPEYTWLMGFVSTAIATLTAFLVVYQAKQVKAQ